MVAPVENWTEIEGEVLAVRAGATDRDVEIDVRVETTRPVVGFESRLDVAAGKILVVRVKATAAAGLSLVPGKHVRARVRRGRDRRVVFAHTREISVDFA